MVEIHEINPGIPISGSNQYSPPSIPFIHVFHFRSFLQPFKIKVEV